MNQADKDVSKDIERLQEQLKQLELEKKIEETADKLDELAKKQEKLETQTKNKEENKEALAKKQEDLKKEFEGIKNDLDKIDYEAIKEREEKIHEEAHNSNISKMSREYINLAGKWFDASRYIFVEKEKQLNIEYEMDLPKSNPDLEANILEDAISVIMWYKFQIHVKIMRAVSGAMEDEDLQDEYDFLKDSDGSAKVALIGIDRSISAWEKLLIIFPEEEDSFLKILALLLKLRKSVEKTFPDARSFKRPGFD